MRKHPRWSHSHLATAVAAVTLAFSSAASAQLEEVIVTAQKTETSLQDKPIAISAFSQEQLDIALINDTMNLQFNVPNMLMGNLTDKQNRDTFSMSRVKNPVALGIKVTQIN